MKKLFLGTVACIFLSTTAFGVVSFTTRTLDVSPIGTRVTVAVGDVDADGKNELVVVSGDGPLTIWSVAKNGDATLKHTVSLNAPPPGNWTYAQPRILDVDGDGDKDIALYLRSSNQPGILQLVKWNGGHYSVGTYTMPESDAAYGFDMADIDGDGIADAVTANSGTFAPQGVFVSSGASGFTSSQFYAWPFSGAPDVFGPEQRGIIYVYARDLDGDGRADIAVSSAPYNSVAGHIWFNKAGFGLTQQQDLVGRPSIDLGIGDFNADGKPDIIANGDHTNDVKVYRGPQFTTVSTFRIPPDPRTPVVADFSGDGKNDVALAVTFNKNVNIIVAGSQGSTAVNSADFDAVDFMADSYVQELAAGDVDNDGRADVLFATDRVVWVHVASADVTPPAITFPAAITAEATSAAGAKVTWTASANDLVDGALPVTCTPASGTTFAIGITNVTCTAKDAAGNVGTGSFKVTVSDTKPPVLSLPASLSAAATAANGATVTFSATATDVVSGNVAVQCTPASGSVFALGTTQVSCSATDGSGNTATGSFNVLVSDSAAPSLTLPSPITLEATSAAGAIATWTATAVDAIDGAVTVQCAPTSGSTFVLGATNVHCEAQDASGNHATGDFAVTVVDTTAPKLTLPNDLTAEATSANGVVVTFSTSATDVVSGNVSVQCAPASGTTFAIGTTTVHCSAADAAGNAANGSFQVVVRDTTAPSLQLPANITAEATSANGAVVTFGASASDTVSGSVAVQCTPASGSTFALGTKSVSCSATDAAGNAASGSFTVTVRDSIAPALNLPANLTTEATSASGAAVTFTANATDNVSGNVAVTCTPASGATFAIGTTTVNCSASDALGNQATGSFTVTVRDTVAPTLKLPSNPVAEATSAAGGIVAFSATATDAVSGNVSVSCTPASGSLFAIGLTTVNCGAKDAAGNGATGSFTVLVRDTTAPTLKLPANITVEATSPSGAVVTFSASATDAVSGSVGVQCTPASGSTFAIGTKSVSCSAKDAAGNSAAGSFTVTVRDTTAPTITRLSATPNALTPPNHKMVAVAVSVGTLDRGDTAPTATITKVTSNEPENGTGDGDMAPDWAITGPLSVNLRAERAGKGTGRIYTITVTVKDKFGNATTGTVQVTVK